MKNGIKAKEKISHMETFFKWPSRSVHAKNYPRFCNIYFPNAWGVVFSLTSYNQFGLNYRNYLHKSFSSFFTVFVFQLVLAVMHLKVENLTYNGRKVRLCTGIEHRIVRRKISKPIELCFHLVLFFCLPQITCSDCGHESVKYQPFTFLSVPLLSESYHTFGKYTVYNCLSLMCFAAIIFCSSITHLVTFLILDLLWDSWVINFMPFQSSFSSSVVHVKPKPAYVITLANHNICKQHTAPIIITAKIQVWHQGQEHCVRASQDCFWFYYYLVEKVTAIFLANTRA